MNLGVSHSESYALERKGNTVRYEPMLTYRKKVKEANYGFSASRTWLIQYTKITSANFYTFV